MKIEDLRETFKDFHSGIPEPLLEKNKLHLIKENLFLILTTMICGCEGWRDIERSDRVKNAFLRRVFPFTHGIPPNDTLRRFFEP